MTSPNPTVTKDEAEDGNKGCQPISEEAVNESSREAAAATALTTLLEEEDDQEAAEGKGGSRSVHEGEDEHDNDGGERNAVFYEEGDEGKDFRIPLRLTKSGRKRATSFPIKVRQVVSARSCPLGRVAINCSVSDVLSHRDLFTAYEGSLSGAERRNYCMDTFRKSLHDTAT